MLRSTSEAIRLRQIEERLPLGLSRELRSSIAEGLYAREATREATRDTLTPDNSYRARRRDYLTRRREEFPVTPTAFVERYEADTADRLAQYGTRSFMEARRREATGGLYRDPGERDAMAKYEPDRLAAELRAQLPAPDAGRVPLPAPQPGAAEGFSPEVPATTGGDALAQLLRHESAAIGVPEALALALARQESRLRPDAVSPKGAHGVMQLMPDTAAELEQRLGMKPGATRRDPRANIRAGLTYFRDQLEATGGDARLALARYNAGPGAVAKHGGVPPYRETREYIDRILAGAGITRAEVGAPAEGPQPGTFSTISGATGGPLRGLTTAGGRGAEAAEQLQALGARQAFFERRERLEFGSRADRQQMEQTLAAMRAEGATVAQLAEQVQRWRLGGELDPEAVEDVQRDVDSALRYRSDVAASRRSPFLKRLDVLDALQRR